MRIISQYPNKKDLFITLNSEDIAMEEKIIGFVSNYFSKISVAAVDVTSGTVSVGDTLHFLGHTTDFESPVNSMQIERESVTVAKKGDSIGIKVPEKVREGDKVYRVVAD
jgi:translation elongation factor EF-1alpha